MGPRSLFFALALASQGCGDATPATDTGLPPDGAIPDAATTVVAPPDIPWLDAGTPPIALPTWGDCASGWRRVEDDAGASHCEPYPADGPATCAPGEAHFMGGAGCEPVGGSCPSGPFADGLPAGTVYVDPMAGGGGDGSLASPYASLADVPWRSLAPGTTVALAKGTFDGAMYVGDGTTVVGACARDTILTGASSGSTVAISGSGAATVRDITISGAPGGAVFAWAGHDLTLEGVIIEHVAGHALQVQSGGSVTLSRVVIRDGEPPSAGAFPRGVVAALGGHLTLSNVLLERLLGAAMHAQDPDTTITGEDVVVRDTATEPGTGEYGAAALANSGSTIDLRRALFEQCRKVAALAIQPGTAVILEQVIVRDMVRPSFGSIISNGLVSNAGGLVVADDVVVERYFEYAAVASGAGSRVELSDAILSGGRMSREGRSGRGFGANAQASIVVSRALVEDFDGVGIFFAEPGTTAELEDIVIRDTAESAPIGSGVEIVDGASVVLTRARVERVNNGGVLAGYGGASLVAEDLAVRDVLPVRGIDQFGHGIEAQGDASIAVRRVLVERVREGGISAIVGAGHLEAEDVVVRDVLPSLATGLHGQGFSAQPGVVATLRRARIEGIHEVGLAALGSTLDASDVVVSMVALDGCREGSCPSTGGDYTAIGAMSSLSGQLTLTRFLVEGAQVCGVLVDAAAGLDLAEGVVSGSGIGACVQSDGYSLDRLTEGVIYRDNGVNLDSTSLPVPGAIGGVAAEE